MLTDDRLDQIVSEFDDDFESLTLHQKDVFAAVITASFPRMLGMLGERLELAGLDKASLTDEDNFELGRFLAREQIEYGLWAARKADPDSREIRLNPGDILVVVDAAVRSFKIQTTAHLN